MYKVLIAEDDPMVAMINEQYIKKNKNFEVVGSCRDGVSALAFLETHEVDLLVLDVYMPGMNGFEALREIRKRRLETDVIMVTAANDREALGEALHLGAVDYLVKPFTLDRFLAALEKYIAQRNALGDIEKLNQNSIDHIIDGSRRQSRELYPKGIQKSTLEMILRQMESDGEKWYTGEDIAELTGLTAVTVRRYMSYLADAGRVESDIDYETGGRPRTLYHLC